MHFAFLESPMDIAWCSTLFYDTEVKSKLISPKLSIMEGKYRGRVEVEVEVEANRDRTKGLARATLLSHDTLNSTAEQALIGLLTLSCQRRSTRSSRRRRTQRATLIYIYHGILAIITNVFKTTSDSDSDGPTVDGGPVGRLDTVHACPIPTNTRPIAPPTESRHIVFVDIS